MGGDVAENADFDAMVDLWTPRVLAIVLSLSFVVLLLAFRSLVVPVKAILLNLLSVAAAYGAMVFVPTALMSGRLAADRVTGLADQRAGTHIGSGRP